MYASYEFELYFYHLPFPRNNSVINLSFVWGMWFLYWLIEMLLKPRNLWSHTWSQDLKLSFFSFLKYLFILAALGLSCSTCDPPCCIWDLLVAGLGLLSCGVNVGSSSPTRDWTPYIGSTEPYPLDHEGSPKAQVPDVFSQKEFSERQSDR